MNPLLGHLVGPSLFSALVGAVGCAAEPAAVVDVVSDVDFSSPVQGARAGRLAGDLGPVADIDAPAGRLGAWDDGSYLAVESAAQLGDRAVMIFVSASNASDVFVPGGRGHYVFGDYDGVGAQVGVLGCVGQAIDTYDIYDAPADEVDVVVEVAGADDAGPADVDVTVIGTWFIDVAGVERELRTASSHFTLER